MTMEFRIRKIESGLYEVWLDGSPVGEIERLTAVDVINASVWEARSGQWSLTTDRKRTAKDAIIRYVTSPHDGERVLASAEVAGMGVDSKTDSRAYLDTLDEVKLDGAAPFDVEDAFRFGCLGFAAFYGDLFAARKFGGVLSSDPDTFNLSPARARAVADAMRALELAIRAVENV